MQGHHALGRSPPHQCSHSRRACRRQKGFGYRLENDPTAAVAKTKPKDDDPEPATSRPAAASASQEVRAAATKEIPASQAYCQKDPALSAVLNCQYFSRAVYSYRIAHSGETQSIAGLVAGEKLNLSESIDYARVMSGVRDRAATQKLSQQVINCIHQNVITALYKQPQFNNVQVFNKKVQELYKQAVAECGR